MSGAAGGETDRIGQGDPTSSRLQRAAAAIASELAAFRSVIGNRDLCMLQLSWAALTFAMWSYAIALGIYAYDEGGAAAVGLVGLLRLLPGAIAAPFAGVVADSGSRQRILLVTAAAMAVTLAGSAAIGIGDGPPWAIYALAGLFSLVACPFVPTERALQPKLARTPTELAAATVTHTVTDNFGFMVGSIAAAVVLTGGSTGYMFAVASIAAIAATAMVLTITRDVRDDDLEPAHAGGVARETLRGFGLIAANRSLRVPAVVIGLLALAEGAADVITVVLTLDLLGLGDSAVGFLNATWGAAAVVGGAMLALLLNRRKLALGTILGVSATAIALILPAAVPTVAAAFIGFAIFGIAYSVGEAAAQTLMQRLGDDETLGRVMGTLESTRLAAMAAGAMLVPLLIDVAGLRIAMVTVALALPLYALVNIRTLRSLEIGAPLEQREYELLRSNPIFAPLPIATVEGLCHQLEPVTVALGANVIEEGERADRFYLIDSGEVDVFQGGEFRRTQGPGESFGEIALLRDTPRTATVTARTELRLLALERARFVGAVTAHERSATRANTVADERLAAGS